MKIVGVRGDDKLLVRNDATAQGDDQDAWVVSPGDTTLGRPYNRESIIARGYWEAPTGDEVLPDQFSGSPEDAGAPSDPELDDSP